MNNLQLGLKKLRDRGIDLATDNNLTFIALMRGIARTISRRKGKVSSMDLREYAQAHDMAPRHPNAYGAIFATKEWECIGRERSSVVSRRGGEVKIWRLREGNALTAEKPEKPTCWHCEKAIAPKRTWQHFCDNHGKCRNAYHMAKR